MRGAWTSARYVNKLAFNRFPITRVSIPLILVELRCKITKKTADTQIFRCLIFRAFPLTYFRHRGA